jgi:hypothetical protein
MRLRGLFGRLLLLDKLTLPRSDAAPFFIIFAFFSVDLQHLEKVGLSLVTRQWAIRRNPFEIL